MAADTRGLGSEIIEMDQNYDPELDPEFVASYHSDANVLNLDENRDMPSTIPESALDYNANGQPIAEPDQGQGQGDAETEMCPGGVLDEDSVASGLSNLGRSADGDKQVYLHLALPGFSMKDISLLCEFEHLQKVELPYNELTDLKALGNMPHLLEIDVSHNKLTSLLDFNPPKNLKMADFSFNEIEEIPDLSAHHCLMILNIENNQIKEIKNLGKCHRLRKLSLAHNHIEKIQGLHALPITHLNLSSNKLKKIENIRELDRLQAINLSGNQIRSFEGLQGHEYLECVDLEDNEIIDLSEVQYVQKLLLLRQLNLQRNPIRELPDYRLSILFHVGQLTDLDNRRVDIEEKVSATNMFSPPLEVIASRDHMMHVVYSFLQPSRILDSTLPSIETPYPMLVLVGPQGAGKQNLALKLVEEFPDYFGYGVAHTTRKPLPDEVQGKDYNFVSLEEFEETIKSGKFLQTYSYHGELFGLTIDAIEAVAREGLACVVHMEIEGVLTLKNTSFEPRYVLIMPLSEDAHEKRLRNRNAYSETQIAWTLDRSELYADYNREKPGFFDMVVNSDDIVEAYKRLRHLVMDYLGIRAPTPSVSDLEPYMMDSNFLDKEYTTDTMGQTTSANNLARTWSKPSLADSATQQALASLKAKTGSPMLTHGRGIVEEESLKRRQSAAKEAISGSRPSLLDHILQSAPRTVPQSLNSTMGLGDNDTMISQRAYSAPNQNMDALPPESPDSSESRSGGESSLSNISEARDIDEEVPDSPSSELQLPVEALDRITLMSGSASNKHSPPLIAPRPQSAGSRPGSGRPGSGRHPVLPPIGQSPRPVEMLPEV